MKLLIPRSIRDDDGFNLFNSRVELTPFDVIFALLDEGVFLLGG